MNVATMSDAELRFASHCYTGQIAKCTGDMQRLLGLLEVANEVMDEQCRRFTVETDRICAAYRELNRRLFEDTQ